MGYEQAAPKDWREKLAQASRRQMARLTSRDLAQATAAASSVDFERRMHAMLDCPPEQRTFHARRSDVGRNGFYVQLRYGQVVATGILDGDPTGSQ
jgi:hypothetical protein